MTMGTAIAITAIATTAFNAAYATHTTLGFITFKTGLITTLGFMVHYGYIRF